MPLGAHDWSINIYLSIARGTCPTPARALDTLTVFPCSCMVHHIPLARSNDEGGRGSGLLLSSSHTHCIPGAVTAARRCLLYTSPSPRD